MKQDLVASARAALVALLAFTVLTGIAYPALMIAFAKTTRAEPALDLVGQPFAAPGYFWGRPSATSPGAYNATASTGTNLAQSNPALHDAARDRVAALRAADPDAGPIPADLVTSSASGLDPDISPEAAHYQARRVAEARGVPLAVVEALIDDAVEDRTLGILGEPRVNVARLNRALDAKAGAPRSAQRAP